VAEDGGLGLARRAAGEQQRGGVGERQLDGRDRLRGVRRLQRRVRAVVRRRAVDEDMRAQAAIGQRSSQRLDELGIDVTSEVKAQAGSS
jgi:hypothetical protein